MTEIYGTLGPKCSDEKTLYAMFENGMTGVRLNLSHTSLKASQNLLETYFHAAARFGITPKLLVDLQGPELRIGKLQEPLLLEETQNVILGENGLPVPSVVQQALLPGQQILLDDGKILLQVRELSSCGAVCTIIRGGLLKSSKSIALPGISLYPPTLTAADEENLSIAAACGVTGVMQPFVRNAEDLHTVRNALRKAGASQIRIFAKIENLDGVKHLDELLPACDEIVIARGDLGNAVPLWELPVIQRRISLACKKAGVPFMVVTQMLASMEQNPVPTRAEVSDIFHAVLDGASSVMVTGETAAGNYPADVIRYLANTVKAAEHYLTSEV